MQLKTAIALAVTIVCWASAFVGIRAALEAYAPGHLALLRFLIGSVVFAGLSTIGRVRHPCPGDFPAIALAGFLGIALYHAFLNYGELTVTAGTASFVVNTGPAFTALLASLSLGERLTKWGWVGICISLVGASLMGMGKGDGLHFDRGVLLVLLATIAQACYFVLQKPYLKRYGAIQFTAYSVWVGTAFLLVFLPGLVQATLEAPLSATLTVIYLGIFPTALAYSMWAFVLARLTVVKATSFLYVLPALTVVIGWTWLKEIPSVVSLTGGVLALLGVLIVTHSEPGK